MDNAPFHDVDPDQVFDIFWGTLSWDERLEYVLHTSAPSQWFSEACLWTIEHFSTSPVHWGYILSRFKEIGGYGKHLENAVKALGVPVEHQEKLLQKPQKTSGSDPGDFLPAVPPGLPPLRTNKQGIPYVDAGNFDTILRHYPPWAGHCWWDSFQQVVMHDDVPIDDAFVTRIAVWCSNMLGMPVRSEEQLRRCLYAIAQETAHDPLLEYVQGLQWDGHERLATWIVQYAGADDTPANRWIGQALLCAMVARALSPGCIQRFVVIFEGEENIGKSTLVKALGHPWAHTLSRDVDTKDAMMLLRGCWAMEVPELDSFSRSEDSRVKAFVSDPEDSLVLKFSNVRTTYKRRTVLIGTVNPNGNGYLKGTTGNTRYLPVWLNAIDLAGFQAVRDQLFAEAKTLIDRQYVWWQEPKGDFLASVREERREKDVYEEKLAQWLFHDDVLTRPLVPFTMADALRDGLGIHEPEKWKDRSLTTRLGMILNRLGFRPKDFYEHGQKIGKYVAKEGRR